jgi:hypothetical protein
VQLELWVAGAEFVAESKRLWGDWADRSDGVPQASPTDD